MDPNNVSTVVYQINETLKEDLKNSPKYTVTRLDKRFGKNHDR